MQSNPVIQPVELQCTKSSDDNTVNFTASETFRVPRLDFVDGVCSLKSTSESIQVSKNWYAQYFFKFFFSKKRFFARVPIL